MKIDTENMYFVMKPFPQVENFEELLVDTERNLADLEDLFSGGIEAKDIYGIYTDRKSALKDALTLWEDILKNEEMEKMPIEDSRKIRFQDFVEELEMLSNKHNIAIQSIGGVYIFEDPQIINYDADETSGDLISNWREPEN